MSNRPTNTPIWTDGDSAKQVEPSSGLKNTGWQYKDKPPFEYLNWLFYNIYNFIKWIIGGHAYIKQVSSANYTILDDDNYSVILVTTGASDRTIILPAISTNKSRKIKIKKVDDGLGNVIISRAGSDTIETATSIILTKKYDTLEIANDETSDWKFVFSNAFSSSKDSITAYAGGGQANATQLNNSVNRITTCATIGDSVKLPSVFKDGDSIIVINDGATASDVFPASGHSINGMAANTAFRLLPTARITFVAISATSWIAISSHNQEINIGDVRISTSNDKKFNEADCDGSAISRTTYDKLFAKLSTTWGAGNGSTTFNIPDLRSATLRGVGTPTIFTQNKAVTLAEIINDAFQGHYHYSASPNSTLIGSTTNQAVTAGGGTGVLQSNVGSYDVGNPKADASNGTPRTGLETTSKARGVYFFIKLF